MSALDSRVHLGKCTQPTPSPLQRLQLSNASSRACPSHCKGWAAMRVHVLMTPTTRERLPRERYRHFLRLRGRRVEKHTVVPTRTRVRPNRAVSAGPGDGPVKGND